MKIYLQSITLENFKGIKEFTAFFGKETTIKGANATGKSTLVDSFLWLLTGKDSENRADFEIKTVDEKNDPIHHLQHSVTGVLDIDGESVVLKRVYQEIWRKTQGEQEAHLAGNETLYFWNDVPLKQKEYSAKINDLIQPDILKLITNPFYFVSLKKDIRRAMLIDIANVPSSESLLASDKYEELQNYLSGKSIQDFKKEVAYKKKGYNEELKSIPGKIQERTAMIPSELPDFAKISSEISKREKELKDIDASISDLNKQVEEDNKLFTANQKKIRELQSQVTKIENDTRADFNKKSSDKRERINDLRSKIETQKNEIPRISTSITDLEDKIKIKEKEKSDKLAEWYTENEKELTITDDFNCPTCGQSLPEEMREKKVETLTASFNLDKTKKLDLIVKDGNTIKEAIASYEKNIEGYKSKQKECEDKIKSLQDDLVVAENEKGATETVDTILSKNEAYQTAKKLYETLNESKSEAKAADTSEYTQKQNVLRNEISDLKIQLSKKGDIETNKARIIELEKREREISSQIAELEGLEFKATSFEQDQITAVETAVNAKFNLVKIKMFNEQINGGTESTCEILVNGVLFEAANSAGKLAAGLDIIKTFSNYYDIEAPIFCDNRESVTDIPETNSQIINLYVDPTYTKLTVL